MWRRRETKFEPLGGWIRGWKAPYPEGKGGILALVRITEDLIEALPSPEFLNAPRIASWEREYQGIRPGRPGWGVVLTVGVSQQVTRPEIIISLYSRHEDVGGYIFQDHIVGGDLGRVVLKPPDR